MSVWVILPLVIHWQSEVVTYVVRVEIFRKTPSTYLSTICTTPSISFSGDFIPFFARFSMLTKKNIHISAPHSV